jgi:hypothetical protein
MDDTGRVIAADEVWALHDRRHRYDARCADQQADHEHADQPRARAQTTIHLCNVRR